MAHEANSPRHDSAQDSKSVGIWMPWFIRDHRAFASTLTHLEHSAYCYLSMLFWEHDGSLPNDDKFLARHLRLPVKQWREMRDTILIECTIAGSTITHPKIVTEVAKARANVEQKRRAGIASAEARKAAREVNGCSTGVQRALQRNGNGEATARQPRAGGGAGGGLSLSHESDYGDDVSSKPFRVVEGGGK